MAIVLEHKSTDKKSNSRTSSKIKFKNQVQKSSSNSRTSLKIPNSKNWEHRL
jgi:hypothetical protein